VGERVRSFLKKAKAQGISTDEKALGLPARSKLHPVMSFFYPVGQKDWLKEEVLFLAAAGMPYESIMRMPVPFRKELIERKLGKSSSQPKDFGDDALGAAVSKARMLAGNQSMMDQMARMAESPTNG